MELTEVILQPDDITVVKATIIVPSTMGPPAQLTPTILDYVVMAMRIMCQKTPSSTSCSISVAVISSPVYSLSPVYIMHQASATIVYVSISILELGRNPRNTIHTFFKENFQVMRICDNQ